MNKYYPEIFFRTACIWRLFRKYRDKALFGITLSNWRIPLCWLFPISPGLRGVDSANFAAVFSHAEKPETDKMGVKKQETFFLDFLFRIFANSGGYPVVIPRKKTCSLCLKLSLCRWGGGCPALSFSVDCISHLPRLTGSFRFPCSTRLQRFALLWIPSPDWRQGNRVRRIPDGWGKCPCRLLIPGVGVIWFPIPEK